MSSSEMKRICRVLLIVVGCGVLAVSVIGLGFCCVGQICDRQTLIEWGLILALPYWVIVLPFCLLILAMVPIAIVLQIVLWTYKRITRRNSRSDPRGA